MHTIVKDRSWANRKINKYQTVVEELLGKAGITINGSAPYDIQVKNDLFFERVLRDGSLGLGEAYMDGWWECEQIDQMFYLLTKAKTRKKLNKNLKLILWALKAKVKPSGKLSEAYQVAKKHYDIKQDIFEATLDSRMMYTCGYWKDAENLEQAQEHKLHLICKKLLLKPGMHILEIGSGWGGFAKFAAENYGVKVTGITISKEQYDYSLKLCSGLPVEFRLEDYRQTQGKFDRVVVVGMIEHVGHAYYRTFMEKVAESLKDDGLFLLHTIGSNIPMTPKDAPFILKYIFPNGDLPTIKRIGEAIENLFIMEDWQNFGTDYVNTLDAWHSKFLKSWDALEEKYDTRFLRMWKYYLLVSKGGFMARDCQLWQLVLSKEGTPGGYQKYVDYKFE